MKKYADGGLAGVMDEEMARSLGKAGGISDKKNLPSEDISPLQKTPQPNLTNRISNAVKGAGQRLKDNVMGTEEQNKAAQERMDKAKTKKMAKGGSVSSASKRADGCAIRGKTRA